MGMRSLWATGSVSRHTGAGMTRVRRACAVAAVLTASLLLSPVRAHALGVAGIGDQSGSMSWDAWIGNSCTANWMLIEGPVPQTTTNPLVPVASLKATIWVTCQQSTMLQLGIESTQICPGLGDNSASFTGTSMGPLTCTLQNPQAPMTYDASFWASSDAGWGVTGSLSTMVLPGLELSVGHG